MNWKNRLTNYNFWISIVSAVLLILQALKIEFDIAYINEIATAVLGLLVVIGIISDPTRYTVKDNMNSKNQQKEDNFEIQQKENVILDVKVEKETVLGNDEEETGKKEDVNMPIGNENQVDINTMQNDYENIVKTISMNLEDNISIKNIANCLMQLVENFKEETLESKVENEECNEIEHRLINEDLDGNELHSSDETLNVVVENFNNIVN